MMPDAQYLAIIIILMLNASMIYIDANAHAALSQPGTNSRARANLMLVAEQEPARCMLHCVPTWCPGMPG